MSPVFCSLYKFSNIFFSRSLIISPRTLSLVFICRENPRQSRILLFADHSRFCRYIGYSPEVCPRFSRNDTFICDRGTGVQQFRGLVMSEIHRRRPWRYKFEFSYVGNDQTVWDFPIIWKPGFSGATSVLKKIISQVVFSRFLRFEVTY